MRIYSAYIRIYAHKKTPLFEDNYIIMILDNDNNLERNEDDNYKLSANKA